MAVLDRVHLAHCQFEPHVVVQCSSVSQQRVDVKEVRCLEVYLRVGVKEVSY